MTENIAITVDGREISCAAGQTILAAAEQAGVYIPRLCHMNGLVPHGSCRVCTVVVNGRPQAACTTPVVPGMSIESESERVRALRRDIVHMLFIEGNHFCMFCEKSGNCELQALAYRLGMTDPKYPALEPHRAVDASHPDILMDHNRCILCARCVRTSRDADGKHVFGMVGRGHHKRVAVNARGGLGATNAQVIDKAISACPVGAILRKRVGYKVPVGQRQYDAKPIGSDIEAAQAAK